MGFLLKYYFLALFAPRSRSFLEFKLYKYLNRERKKRGLWPLFYQKDLRDVGRKHSKDMAKNSYFAHESLDGSSPKDRFQASNVSEAVSGENLAKVRGYKNPVLVSHDGLMNSPGHKANILSRSYNCVGIGLAISLDRTYYFTQNFSYRYLLLDNYPSKIWFSNFLHLKGKVILDDLKEVLVVLKNDYTKEEMSKQRFILNNENKFNFKIKLAEMTRYEVQVFVLVGDLNKYKLSNHFKLKKGIF